MAEYEIIPRLNGDEGTPIEEHIALVVKEHEGKYQLCLVNRSRDGETIVAHETTAEEFILIGNRFLDVPY